MVRVYKQQERRNRSPRKHDVLNPLPAKTGAKKDNLPDGHKPHQNAVSGDIASKCFIAKRLKK